MRKCRVMLITYVHLCGVAGSARSDCLWCIKLKSDRSGGHHPAAVIHPTKRSESGQGLCNP